jgi:hypothetical protein
MRYSNRISVRWFGRGHSLENKNPISTLNKVFSWYSNMIPYSYTSIKMTGVCQYGFDNIIYSTSYLGELYNDRNQNSGTEYSKV